MKKGDTIPGICFAAIGVLTLFYIVSNSRMAVFAKSSDGGLGPGFFPFVCGVSLVILGILLALRGIAQKGTMDYFGMTPEKKENFKVAGLLILLCGLMLACWKLSNLFFGCLPVYAFAVNKLLKRSTRFSIIFTLVMTLFIYVLFHVCFSIRFET